MQLVLEKISKIYVLGAVEFYAKQNPNPWQDAHDKLEGKILLYRYQADYFEKIQPAYRDFFKECKSLLDAYKHVVSATRIEPRIPDCLMVGDENKLNGLYALASNSCKSCETDKNVRATTHPSLGASIFCTGCVP